MKKKTINKFMAISLLCLTACAPKVKPAADITIKKTPERLARGEYLVNNVSACLSCHSTHDNSKFGRPIVPGTRGKGGELFGEDEGLPGDIYAANLTPASLKDWTDGEIVRAITTGVSKDGHALFPIMPYYSFGKMSKEDIYAIVTYLRTLEPIENEVPKTRLNFPVNFIVNSMPKEAESMAVPDKKDTVAYGGYLANAASCAECHTPRDKGEPIKGMSFAGGSPFIFPDGRGTVNSTNITPDKETGIGYWTRDMFIAHFKNYEGKDLPLENNEFNTFMPWMSYAGMSEEDLGAIFDFLMAQKPVKNVVEKFIPNKDD